MRSRNVHIALLVLTLAFAGAAGAATRPAGARKPPSTVATWLGWLWDSWTRTADKSRGTMDPDGTPLTSDNTTAPTNPTPATPTSAAIPTTSTNALHTTLAPGGVP